MSSENIQIPASIIALLAGLLGSICTIAIGKALDLIQKRQEHKYSLQKAFFERKLNVAEAVVGNFQRQINLLEPLGKIITKIPTYSQIQDTAFRDFIESQVNIISSEFQKVVQETQDCFYAAPLYFDMARLNRISSLSWEKILNSMLMLHI